MAENWDARPPGGRERLLNAPGIVTGLVGFLTAIHLVRFLLPTRLDWDIVTSFAVVPARYAGLVGEPAPFAPEGMLGLLLPLVTYSLFHGDLLHLGLNSIWILAVGTPVARRIGPLRFVLFCLLTAMLSALFYVLLRLESPVPVIGASGVGSALLGAALRYMFGEHASPTGPPVAIGDRRILLVAAVWIAINLAMGLTGVAVGAPAETIAWEAHIGGFLAGLLLLPLFDNRPPDRSHPVADPG